MNVLIVDNDFNFLCQAKKLFVKNGHYALTASKGPEALEKLRQNIIHVILIGLTSPGMEGIETLKEIKRHFPLAQIIMLAGLSMLGLAVDGLTRGATDFLIKPIDNEELLQKAEAAFSKRRYLEQKIRDKQIQILEQQFG